MKAKGAVSYHWAFVFQGSSNWSSSLAADINSSTLSFKIDPDFISEQWGTLRCQVSFADGTEAMTNSISFITRKPLLDSSLVRKLVHTVEFFPVGLFVSLTAFSFFRGLSRCRFRLLVLGTFFFCLLMFLLNQVHKLFVTVREFDASDLLFDFVGYALSVFVVFSIWHVRREHAADMRARKDLP